MVRFGQLIVAVASVALVATAPVDAANPFKSGTYVRSKINDLCNRPDDCNYKCSAAYSLEASGESSVVATPVPKPDGCACMSLTATVDSATGKAEGSSAAAQASYSLTRSTDGTIQVITTVNGVQCTGEYAEGTYSSAHALGLSYYQVAAVATAVTALAVQVLQ